MNRSASVIIAAGLVFASVIFGIFFYHARNQNRTIRVVGYATESFEADLVKWSVELSEHTQGEEVNQAYRRLNQKVTTFEQMLKSLNIEIDEKNIQPVNVRQQYGREGLVVGHNLTQRIYIISKDLQSVSDAAVNPTEFLDKGLSFHMSRLQYFSTSLPEIKKQLLAKATKNARERAEEISGAAGHTIQKLIRANAGVFQITEPYSTEVSGYGIHNTSSKRKNIKVTVAATFSIE